MITPRITRLVRVPDLQGMQAFVVRCLETADARATAIIVPTRSAAEMLRDTGFRVEEAADARGALEVLARSNPPVDLVVSDVVMPGIGGPELAELIRERAPGVPIVFVSGHADIVPNAPGLRGSMLLRKPLDRTALIDEIEIALSNRARRS